MLQLVGAFVSCKFGCNSSFFISIELHIQLQLDTFSVSSFVLAGIVAISRFIFVTCKFGWNSSYFISIQLHIQLQLGTFYTRSIVAMEVETEHL
jgi:hypothetical protein